MTTSKISDERLAEIVAEYQGVLEGFGDMLTRDGAELIFDVRDALRELQERRKGETDRLDREYCYGAHQAAAIEQLNNDGEQSHDPHRPRRAGEAVEG